MFKKCVSVLLAWGFFIGLACAEVEVNTAAQAALDGIKGVGPTLSKTILAERAQQGEYKNWSDLEKRVHGIGAKKAVQLSEAGLVVNGQARGVPVVGAADKGATSKNKSSM